MLGGGEARSAVPATLGAKLTGTGLFPAYSDLDTPTSRRNQHEIQKS